MKFIIEVDVNAVRRLGTVVEKAEELGRFLLGTVPAGADLSVFLDRIERDSAVLLESFPDGEQPGDNCFARIRVTREDFDTTCRSPQQAAERGGSHAIYSATDKKIEVVDHTPENGV